MKCSFLFNFTSGRVVRASLCAVITAGLALSQEPSSNAPASNPPSSSAPSAQPAPAGGGWPQASGPQGTVPTAQNNPAPPPYASDPGSGQNPQQNPGYGPPYGGYPAGAPPYGQNGGYQPAPPPSGPVPARLTLPQGTYVTVRVNQTLSSDKNHPGDAFSATLAKPIIVDGVVVAQSGQTLGGRVVEAEKAGRIEGTSKLRIQLTDLTLVDGQQVPIQSQFINWRGPTSVGRDAAAVAGTTALGAAAGAAADWGRGAAIGAGAGAVVGVIGVLLTRGRPTIIPPESVLTFRVEAPVAISTEHAPQAFRYAEPQDYGQPPMSQPPAYASAPVGPPPPPAYYYGGYAPGYYYPYWGPSFYFWGGPGFYYGPRFYGGFYGYRGYGGYRGGFRR
ncbi:MAG: hypothetical protein WAM39_27855 [Bryobacteraceae bacterium]